MKDEWFWAFTFVLWLLTALFFLFFLGVTNSGSAFYFGFIGVGFGSGAGFCAAKLIVALRSRP